MSYLCSLETDLAHFEAAEDAAERRALHLESIREDLIKQALEGHRNHDWLAWDSQLEPQDKQFGYRAANCLALYGDSAPAVVVRRLEAWRREAIADWAKMQAEEELERECEADASDEYESHVENYGLPREAA